MSAGTLTLTNNSAAVAGSGTAFTTEVAGGDFIVVTVGGVPYTLPVKSVESGTALTLVSNFTGPTQAGAAWSAVPRVALNMVTAALVAQSAEALRGLNYDKQNWQQVFSGTGTITVKLPDQSTFTGPSWKYLADNMATKSGGAVPVNQGGTGSTDASGARTNLGLGTAATKNSGTAIGDLLAVGAAYGLGSNLHGYAYSMPTGFYTGQPDAPTPDYGGGCLRMSAGGYQSEWFSPLAGQVRFFARNINSISGGSAWAEFYSTHNTTKAADGTLKAASPIVKIFHDGSSETNDESEGCAVTRVSVGVYLVEGCTGLNSDAGWGGIDGGFDIPKDRNRQPLIWLDYEVNADGSVLVKTYHRTYHDAPAFARNERPGLNDGDPVDIPADQFVSVRVEMPHDSIWNQKQKEMQEEMEKTEYECDDKQQDIQS
ncbi:phage tail protein [Citrobacter freundii]